MRVLVHKSAFWVLLKGQNTKILRFFLRFWSPKDPLFWVNFFMSPHEMKEEIETKHFEHTRGSRDEPRCRATPHQTGRGVCVSPQPLPWVLSCDEC